jgi:hypothetical protein
MTSGQAVMVHGLAMAREALAAAVSCGCPVTLLSAEGAAGYAGVAWWMALVKAARIAAPTARSRDILDCGAAPGRALEALRAGQKTLILRADPRIWADIAERAEDCGATLLPAPPPCLDLSRPGASRKLAAWLQAPPAAT